jgi:hypothetical protein
MRRYLLIAKIRLNAGAEPFTKECGAILVQAVREGKHPATRDDLLILALQ